MKTLLAVTGKAAGIRYALDRGRTLIGRSSASDIQLLDEAVSRQHAAIERKGRGFEVEDLGSQNGCTLNGARVKGRALLKKGDALAIGETTFLFDPDLDFLAGGSGTDVVIATSETEASSTIEVKARAERAAEGSAELLLEIVARALRSESDEGAVLDAALHLVAQRFSAERAFVLRASDDEGGRPKVVASFGEGPITVSRTVVERVLSERRALASGDAPKDEAFLGGVSLAAGEIRSLIAAPLSADDRAIGMVHLDRRARHAYGPAELAALIPIANVLALVLLASEGVSRLKKHARQRGRIDPPVVVAESEAMKAIVRDTKRAAKARSSILITGETGTGKEVLARLAHVESDRASGPFIAVNCGALPKALQEAELFGSEKGAFTGAEERRIGLFEAADEGTLFLDEIGECDPAAQVKLLRAIQEKVIFRLGGTRALAVDVRIIAATSRRLEEMIAKGAFREDLYYRLAVIHLRVPPLRNRAEDVPYLVKTFSKQIAKEIGVVERTFDGAALDALARHSWPGNVRELRNVVERSILMSDAGEIGLGDLPHDLFAGSEAARRAIGEGETLEEAIQRVEKELILRQMARTGGVKSAVADALGISRVTLDAKLKALGIAWTKGRKPTPPE
jgi:Nif-specific regulatory protein